jgi:polyadenylation factor subunit 2
MAAMSSPLPLLLPQKSIPTPNNASHVEWTPKRYMSEPQPPPMDDMKIQELEMAAARQMMDGKIVKKTRPRRTVDYNGGLGRWALVSLLYVYMLAY